MQIFALLFALCPGAGGCSWMMIRQAPAEYSADTADGPPDCTANLGPAIGDTWDAIAVGGGLTALGVVSLAVSSDDLPGSRQPAVGIGELAGGLGLGTLFGASAHHGYREARRCRQLRDDFQGVLFERTDP